MVFNWFRRGFDKSDASKAEPKSTESAAPEKAPDPASEKPAAPKTLADMTPEERLAWAKAAAQNIQKQQAEAKAAESATEAPAESAVAEPAVDSAPEAPAVETLAEPEPPAAAVEPSVEEAVEEPPVEDSSVVGETAVAEPEVAPEAETVAEEPTPESAAVESVEMVEAAPVEASSVEESTVEEAPIEEAPAEDLISGESIAEETAPTVAEVPAVADMPTANTPTNSETEVDSDEDASEPQVVEAAAQANVPFWARAEEERQQRLERLRETAIVEPEPEPEPVAAPPELVLPDIDLDEAFLWSAEVLAAQGRRPDDISAEEITWLKRLRQGLSKTRLSLVNQLKAIVGQGPLNEDAVMEIEALLLQADVGVAATDKIIEALQDRMRDEVLPPDQAIAYLKTILRDMLDAPLGDSHNLLFVPEKEQLNIWLMTGVNGAGKTTTIGKLAHVAKKSGYNTLIAAADTFRAAAVEQVKAWGARSQVEVIANPGKNTDPAAVVYDAIAAANSRQIELLLVDTAGRLQNKKNLMDELAKIRRIVDKNAPDAKIEALLVLDATLGQNGLRQAEVFAEAANLSGVVLTKLDGTAKGGVALAVVEQLGLPIRFIGAGEGIEDLRPFSSYEFVEALLSG